MRRDVQAASSSLAPERLRPRMPTPSAAARRLTPAPFRGSSRPTPRPGLCSRSRHAALGGADRGVVSIGHRRRLGHRVSTTGSLAGSCAATRSWTTSASTCRRSTRHPVVERGREEIQLRCPPRDTRPVTRGDIRTDTSHARFVSPIAESVQAFALKYGGSGGTYLEAVSNPRIVRRQGLEPRTR